MIVAALTAASGVAYGLSDPSSIILGPLSSILGALVSGHVSNNVALGNLPVRLGRVTRDGFYAAGDGGGATYTLKSGACPLNSGAGDGGSQVSLAGGTGCAYVDLTSLGGVMRPQLFGGKCDGTTDDRAAENKLTTAAAGTALVAQIVPRGLTCAISGQVVLRSNTYARIDGTLFMLAGSNPSAQPIVNYYATINASTTTSNNGGDTNITLDGYGTINGNAANQTATNPLHCVYIYGPSRFITIKNITLTGCDKGSPLDIVGGSATPGVGAAHIYLSYVKVLDSNTTGYSNQFAAGCDDCHADHLLIVGVPDLTFAIYGNVTNSSITNSRIVQGSGITVLNDGDCSRSPLTGNSVVSTNIRIQGNIITDSYASAVSVINGTTKGSTGQPCATVAKHVHIQITGNQGYNNNLAGQSLYGGEFIKDASDVVSVGNTWHDDGFGAASNVLTPGVFIGQNVDHYTSSADLIRNEGGTGIGYLIQSASYVTIVSPTITDDKATQTMLYAFNGACTGTCVISKPSLGTLRGAPFGSLTITPLDDVPIHTIMGSGPPPTFASSASGSSAPPDAYSTDNYGSSNVTATAPTTVTINFGTPFPRTPFCTISSANGAAASIASVNAQKLTVNINSSAGGYIAYQCQ